MNYLNLILTMKWSDNMDIKSNIVLGLFNNNSYFKNLKEYLTEMVDNEKLSFQNLKYLYSKMYIGKSEFIKQNIYPVSEFLIKGYSTQEAEKIAELLPDAHKLTVFCYDEKERGHTYNKLFCDLQFAYNTYDKYMNIDNTKKRAFEIVAEEIENTDIKQREGEARIYEIECNADDTKEFFDYISEKMEKLRNDFEKITINDDRLKEHFKGTNSQDTFYRIMVAGTILGGIDLRNIQRENGNLDGEKEVYPYTKEQIKLIDRYSRLQETIDKIEEYAEQNLNFDEDMEM